MCVCMYICMYVVCMCICMCMYERLCVCMYVCTLLQFVLGASISVDVLYDCTSTSGFSLMFTQFSSCECEDRQSTYDVTLWHDRAAIVTEEKQ